MSANRLAVSKLNLLIIIYFIILVDNSYLLNPHSFFLAPSLKKTVLRINPVLFSVNLQSNGSNGFCNPQD